MFKFHSEPLQDEWLDAYGHLNEAYYLVPFSNTTWLMQEHFLMGVDYFKRTGCALYTVETHLRYLKEVRRPALLEIETLILGSDAKKIWFAHQMVAGGTVRATAEFMILHYDTRQERAARMPDAVQTMLKHAETAQSPDWVGRQVSLHKKPQ